MFNIAEVQYVLISLSGVNMKIGETSHSNPATIRSSTKVERFPGELTIKQVVNHSIVKQSGGKLINLRCRYTIRL